MKPYYITTSIPYVNGKPHLGHAMEFIQSDVIARYAKIMGHDVLFSSGSDEHGGKIEEKANELGITPQALADQNSDVFRHLLADLEITNNRFIRTTSADHIARACLIWENMSHDIYKGEYTGWYCMGCEEYVTETEVSERNNICPDHNRPYEKLVEENYFFKLSKYSDQLRDLIETDQLKVVPASRKKEILSVIKSGLSDISISRPAEKISWGIPVPNDPTQVMYVWVEALMNYITVLGYPDQPDFAKYWPASVQVVGKGILRFHAAIWPAMLLSLGIEVQKELFVHGYVTVDNQKMSKSLGNSVDPYDILTKYGSEAFRYYFLRHIPAHDDGDFSWDKFKNAYDNELANELGNAILRVATMGEKYLNGIIGNVTEAGHDTNAYHEFMGEYRFDRALEFVWELVRGLNQYIDTEKPWMLAKDPQNQSHLGEVLSYMVGCLLEIGRLLQPFLPTTANIIDQTFASGIINKPAVLFPKYDQTPTN